METQLDQLERTPLFHNDFNFQGSWTSIRVCMGSLLKVSSRQKEGFQIEGMEIFSAESSVHVIRLHQLCLWLFRWLLQAAAGLSANSLGNSGPRRHPTTLPRAFPKWHNDSTAKAFKRSKVLTQKIASCLRDIYKSRGNRTPFRFHSEEPWVCVQEHCDAWNTVSKHPRATCWA